MPSLSRSAIPQKGLLLPVDFAPFMPGINTSETKCFHTRPLAESIFAAPPAQHI